MIENYDTQQADLVELSVLMNEDDFRLIMSLKNKKNVSRSALDNLGTLILINMRKNN